MNETSDAPHGSGGSQPAMRQVDHTQPSVAARIVVIQKAAYAVEAELMGFDGIPPLHETAEEVRALEDLTWWAVYAQDVMAGVIAWCRDGDSIEIDRLAIDPAWARRGFGRALVRAVPSADVITVSTGQANHPAVALYESEGFCLVGSTEVEPGTFTSQFRRDRS